MTKDEIRAHFLKTFAAIDGGPVTPVLGTCEACDLEVEKVELKLPDAEAKLLTLPHEAPCGLWCGAGPIAFIGDREDEKHLKPRLRQGRLVPPGPYHAHTNGEPCSRCGRVAPPKDPPAPAVDRAITEASRRPRG